MVKTAIADGYDSHKCPHCGVSIDDDGNIVEGTGKCRWCGKEFAIPLDEDDRLSDCWPTIPEPGNNGKD